MVKNHLITWSPVPCWKKNLRNVTQCNLRNKFKTTQLKKRLTSNQVIFTSFHAIYAWTLQRIASYYNQKKWNIDSGSNVHQQGSWNFQLRGSTVCGILGKGFAFACAICTMSLPWIASVTFCKAHLFFQVYPLTVSLFWPNLSLCTSSSNVTNEWI